MRKKFAMQCTKRLKLFNDFQQCVEKPVFFGINHCVKCFIGLVADAVLSIVRQIFFAKLLRQLL